MINSLSKIEEYTKALNFDVFMKNQMAIDAVMRNLEIIGEACKHIPILLKQAEFCLWIISLLHQYTININKDWAAVPRKRYKSFSYFNKHYSIATGFSKT